MRLVLVFSILLFTPFLLIIDAEYWIPMYKKDTPYCMRRLLYSDGFFPGRHVKVSSDPEVKYGDRRRVVKDGDPWCTGDDFGEWVQVDLGSTKLISGVIIEGWKYGGGKVHWSENWTSGVTHYSVEFSPDGRLWTVIKDENGLPRHFHKEREHESVRTDGFKHGKARASYQSFDPLLHARFFRLRIHAWRSHQCLSLDVYGCDSHWAMGNIQLMQPQTSISIADCHYINPIDVPHSSLTPNSGLHYKYHGIWRVDGTFRMGRDNKWCVMKRFPKDPPWLEFDLLYRRFITRIEVTLFDDVEGGGYRYLDISTVRFSKDGTGWIGYAFNKKTPSRKISYASKPLAARYIRIPTDKFPYRETCVRLHLFGCSDEVQSIGLWSNEGRVKMSRATIHTDKSQISRNALRFIEPGQTLHCTKATSAKVYFRINLSKLFAIARIVFIGKTGRWGAFVTCNHDESRKLLSLFSSLDGRLWSPYGIYNQVHGDRIRQPILSSSMCASCCEESSEALQKSLQRDTTPFMT